jgi:hypothetical protein
MHVGKLYLITCTIGSPPLSEAELNTVLLWPMTLALYGLLPQNSTSLWEMLPTNVMDEAMRLHDECLRAHLATYQGYESASEGG